MTPEEFFAGSSLGAGAYDRVRALLPACEVRVSGSQVSFRGRRGFAWLWRPDRYLRRPATELALSVGLGRRDPSPRWKQVVHPSPRHWVHHLEVHDPAEIDDEVAAWLREAAERAGVAEVPR
ncbi:hypothetical protein GCM10027451_51770 [Geodermatophilus aquaeductus]|uniref:DUF5655 domain-containing protein n=1 Tax=Geodermatophilus aquaeductus TaxID=1564161 RepID=A0A521FV45_9ACTN|nr:DUF5655 domain-containing protein [Geodermatophilus aquaeductus]SMP00037.1 hypothetical protein SAMN06273567_12222 [Geodermatophilus aquaeductus]